MVSNPTIITAARVGHTFNIDPVEVLRSDDFEWHIRVAATRVVNNDYERAKREQESGN